MSRLLLPALPLPLAACVAPLEFEVEGTVAIMTGELDEDAPSIVRDLLEDNPQLETIVLQDVPGSVDDVAALEAARLVRGAGLRTHVPSDGEIASGGVDFFLAGTHRVVDEGGRVGVHSWNEGRIEGSSLPRSNPEHDLYLDYYAEMGLDEDFYWFVLDAANSRDIHWMTRTELEEHGVVTQ
ncbi:MAG: hypothetical protein KTR31_20775 [Myxococcales bacterium]|nr:hypothetical protein [Myxococcales bacterium]